MTNVRCRSSVHDASEDFFMQCVRMARQPSIRMAAPNPSAVTAILS